MKLALALLGAVLLSVGAGLIYPPVGLIVAGLVLVFIAYVWSYLEAKAGSMNETP